jgi:hypothetical protein
MRIHRLADEGVTKMRRKSSKARSASVGDKVSSFKRENIMVHFSTVVLNGPPKL